MDRHTIDLIDVAPSSVETVQPALPCPRCKKPVPQDPMRLVAKEKAGVTAAECADCKRQPPPDPRAIGCVHCGRRLFVSSVLAGQTASCVWCTRDIPIPMGSDDEALKASGEAFKWLVFRDHALLRQFEDKAELVAAMHAGEVRPDDVCMAHRAAEPASLREACRKDGTLHALFDPIGAKASHIGGVVFVVCAALYLCADFYFFGWRQSLIFVTAIVCVTALGAYFWIGFIVLYVLGKLLDVPVGGGTFLSLLIEGFSTALAGAVGGGIAYGVTHLIGRVGRWNDRAAVWRALVIAAGFIVLGSAACTPRPPLFRVSGIVKGVGSVGSGTSSSTVPSLRKVKVELAVATP